MDHFQQELKRCTELLLQNPRYAEVGALAKSSKNVLGRAIALICQQNERKIMQAKTTFTERYWKVATDLFDGHLREAGILDLKACSVFVESETGFLVTFETKLGANTWVPVSRTTPSRVRVSQIKTTVLKPTLRVRVPLLPFPSAFTVIAGATPSVSPGTTSFATTSTTNFVSTAPVTTSTSPSTTAQFSLGSTATSVTTFSTSSAAFVNRGAVCTTSTLTPSASTDTAPASTTLPTVRCISGGAVCRGFSEPCWRVIVLRDLLGLVFEDQIQLPEVLW